MMHRVDFMVMLHKVDRRGFTTRQLLVLFAIKAKPGMNGVELGRALNLPHRSGIQRPVEALMRQGYVEDRRVVLHDLTPSLFFVTDKGEALLADLVPA